MIRPETLHALNDRVVELATQAKIIKGRKLRLDGTCVQTNIHHPTDSGLLVDSVRVLSRFVERAKPLVEGKMASVKEACRSRVRSVRQMAQKLHRLVRRAEAGEQQQAQLAEQQKALYQQLITTTEQMVRQAQQVTTCLIQHTQKQAQRLVAHVEPLLPLVQRVIFQARSRVLQGKQVAASDKVLSLFEPQTRIIPRHKGGAPIEFGRQVEFDEVEGGIITRYEILSHPDEHGQGLQALSHHQRLFGYPPRLLAGDRGVHSAETELKALTAGVQVVAIPAVGKISVVRQAVEHSRRWKRGYRWRAGIEGRIASLRRDYGLRKSVYHGQDGIERWIGLGVIANNLRHIAQGIKRYCQLAEQRNLWHTDCMKRNTTAPNYKGFRFPPEMISHAVWLYFRFSLSFRDVEEILAQRGIVVTYETVRQWCLKFGQTYANELRRRRPRCGDKWHLDEVVLTIRGRKHYLWRAVDQDGNVLDILVQSRRNKQAAKRFFRKLLKGLIYVPRVIITDKLKSYVAAKREILPSVEHRQHKRLNNRAENSHQPTRLREKKMRRFKSAKHAQRFLSAFGPISGHFQPRRHRLSARNYRAILQTRFQTWNEVTEVKRAA